jgi:integrase
MTASVANSLRILIFAKVGLIGDAVEFDKGTLLNLIRLLRYPLGLSDPPALIPVFDPLAPYLAETEQYVRQAKAAHTVKAYRSDWADFEKFCQGREVASLPAAPATVAAYAAEAARRLKARTIERRLTAISQAHQMAGCENPTEDKLVRTVLAGIRRVKGTAQVGKDPLSPELLRRMLGPVSGDLRATRDRALLLVGFAGAFRRSEVVRLRMENLRFTSEGLAVTIPQSKTDQAGEGQTVGIPYGSHPDSCPVRALGAWMEQSGIAEGYLFPALGRWGREASDSPITDHQLAKIIKRLAREAGLDPAVFSGH